MAEHILIAVAWPYASGSRHLGHLAGAYLPADVFARNWRLAGNKVLMVSGSDVHGTPITVRADAEGVTGEVFQSVWKAIGRFRRQRPGDSFRGWLRTITRNKVRDFWKERAGEAQAVGGADAQQWLQSLSAEEEAEPTPTNEPNEVNHLYHRALEMVKSSFEPATWQAFWQVSVEGRPAAEVAEELGMSLNAVYIAKSRVLSRVRLEFAELID